MEDRRIWEAQGKQMVFGREEKEREGKERRGRK